MTLLHDAYTALLSGLITCHPDYPDEIMWEWNGNNITIKPINIERHIYMIRWANGSKQWFLNGKLHREDGPAIEHANGIKEWYLNDKQLSEKEFNKNV